MQNFFFSFLLSLSLIVSISAQTAKPDLVEQNLRKHVSYLASDNLEGRRTGEKGATSAAGYVANMFANYKLKGGFAEKGKVNFLQPFPYTTAITLGAENRLMLTTPSNNRVAELHADWMPFGASPNANLSNVETVFAGYGIVSSEANRNDYAGKNVTGKAVFAFDGSPEKDNPHNITARFNIHAKAKIAKDKGAAALILISRETNFSSDKQTKLDYDPTLGETAVPVVIVSRSVGAMMLGGEEELKKAEKGETLAPNNLKTLIKVNLNKKSGQSYNVIGILEGTDAILKNEAIVIGAHYDHLGFGGAGSLAANSTEIHHGADDNASGVAALIELARKFSAAKNNKRTLIFIAFGGEEEGLLGSKYYVNNPVFPLENTAAMINMDMVGRLNQNKLTIGGIGTASEWKSLVEEFNKKLFPQVSAEDEKFKASIEKALRDKGFQDIEIEVKNGLATLRGTVEETKLAEVMQIVYEIRPPRILNQLIVQKKDSSQKQQNPSVVFAEKARSGDWLNSINPKPFNLQLNEDGFGPSDHSSFYGKKIPVLFFFTGTHLDYHKPTDTAEKINYAGLSQITTYVSEIVKAVDLNPKKPTYTVAKSSGMSGGRTGFNVSLGTIPSYAESNDGLILDGVRDNSPAAKAGIKAGDKIIKLAGKEIRNVSDYTVVLGEMKAETEYEIVVMRGNEKLSLKIIPAARK